MLSNYDHDRRARQDLRGNDKFRYENNLMNKRELRSLEEKYNFEDIEEENQRRMREYDERRRQENERRWQEEEERRRQEEEERRRQELYNKSGSGSSGYSGSSYHSDKDNLDKAYDSLDKLFYYSKKADRYMDIAMNTNLPQKTRKKAIAKAKKYTRKSNRYGWAVNIYRHKDKIDVIVWVVVILIFLYYLFLS